MSEHWIERLGPKGRWIARALPYGPALLVSALLAAKALPAVLAQAGHPAVPLDDAFIHFQYARNLASGHFYTYSPGDGFTAGATSFLWPLLLAPFYLVGFRDLSIIWVAWFFGFLALGALSVECYRLSRRLTGEASALGAGAMCLTFGGFVWFAASGMETVPLAWILVRAARVAAEWCELPDARTSSKRWELVALGIAAPLIRPEGALGTLFTVAALMAYPFGWSKKPWGNRLLGLVPFAGALLIPLVNWVLTGESASNTTAVKWLPLSPYYASWPVLKEAILANVDLFFSTLANGEQWSALFIPKGARPFALIALLAIPIAGWRARRPWRAAFVFAIALSILTPCTYMSFLWNRLRYLWPFIPGWFIGIACAGRLLGEVAAQIRPRWSVVAPVLSGSIAGALAVHLSWSIDDLVKSASAIDQQQVALGRWAKDNLPQDAILGVNDTGAIAYLSERRTFDVVGLTTKGEARYWVAGAGSRFEHYEHLIHDASQRFPTHFIVYPNWMACEPVLGPSLFERSVHDQSILGGVTMVVYPARRDLLGSGDRPIEQPLTGTLIDELDVADLESEAQHGYEIEYGAGKETSNRVFSDTVLTGGKEQEWADGGRTLRWADRFWAHLEPNTPVRLVARLTGAATAEAEVEVHVGQSLVATWSVPASMTAERSVMLPATLVQKLTPIDIRPLHGGSFGSLHYWFEKDPRPSAQAPSSEPTPALQQ